MMDPMAIRVTGDEPEMAAKNMQAITLATASPPLSHPKVSNERLMSLLAISPFDIMAPAKTYKGMERKTDLFTESNMLLTVANKGTSV
jgi:hypothetical protein